jgi:hypothetical protein
MKTDIELFEEMDIKWLLENGWSIKGNLAYRRILDEKRERSEERIEQILMQYECDVQDHNKITQSLRELLELKRDLERD